MKRSFILLLKIMKCDFCTKSFFNVQIKECLYLDLNNITNELRMKSDKM